MTIPKNTKEFSKLFKIIIPYHREFEYYIDTLSKSEKYKDLPSLVSEFAEFEIWCEKHGYENVGNYKMGKVFKEIKSYIEESDAYKRFSSFQDYEYVLEGNRTKDIRNECQGEWLRSIDIKSANFNIINSFGGDLGDSWDDLCKKLFVHPVLAKSKSFRQVIFGNLNPRRNGKYQLSHMNNMVDDLLDRKVIEEDEIVFISNDEVIFKDSVKADISVDKFAISDNRFMFEKIGPKKENKLKTYDSGHKELVGIPSNKFFIHFKQSILNERVEDRDLFFEIDGNLAKWVL